MTTEQQPVEKLSKLEEIHQSLMSEGAVIIDEIKLPDRKDPKNLDIVKHDLILAVSKTPVSLQGVDLVYLQGDGSLHVIEPLGSNATRVFKIRTFSDKDSARAESERIREQLKVA